MTAPASRDDLVRAIATAIKAVAPNAASVDASTRLMGQHAAVDSVGFVTLLVQLEQDLGNGVDLSTSFLEQSSVDESSNPFRTVGSLADHLRHLISVRA
jgi:acyl carrier protein